MQQEWTISKLDYDMQQKVDFMWQPAIADSVIGPRRGSKALSKAKLAPQKGWWSLVVCCQSDPIQLSESQWNHYIWEVCSATQWDGPKTAMPTAGTGQQKGPSSSLWQHPTSRHPTSASSGMNWAMRFLLICHIHLTAWQQITTSSILITFCRENTSTTSRRQKMLSKTSLNCKAWIFTL